MDLIYGVELELEVVDNPERESTFETSYPVMVSYPKGEPQGFMHEQHGNLVQAVSEATKDKVKVGYDFTASKTRYDGLELVGDPMTLTQNVEVWSPVYEALRGYVGVDAEGTTEHGSHISCGMHVHVSGKINALTLGKMAYFIYNKANKSFIKDLTGRYNNPHCAIIEMQDPESIHTIFHSEDCKNAPNARFSERPAKYETVREELSPDEMPKAARLCVGEYKGLPYMAIGRMRTIQAHHSDIGMYVNQGQYFYILDNYVDNKVISLATLDTYKQFVNKWGHEFYILLTNRVKAANHCCEGAKRHLAARYHNNPLANRNAVNLNPLPNTGLFELRLFRSPATIDVFLARLEWVDALLHYGADKGIKDLSFGAFCAWVTSKKRWPYLSDHIKELGYVNPIVETLKTTQRQYIRDAQRSIAGAAISA